MPSSPDFIDAAELYRGSRDGVLIDVRSPSEFADGHIPGATNLPLFSNEERAQVGTRYSNNGHDDAVLLGLEIIGPKMARLARAAQQLLADHPADQRSLFVHCWRGGMRSQSFAWLLETVGLAPKVLAGGYKSFRAMARSKITGKWNLRVVSGLTGAGKTKFLKQMGDAGENVCDLEGLANHRGSAYGGIGQGAQPTTEQFENDLFTVLDQFTPDQPIWVEDEGNRIGRVVVPQEFYEQMRHAPAVFLDVDLPRRVKNLLVDYEHLPVEGLRNATCNIRKGLGGKLTDEAIAAIDCGDIARAVEITLAYYDRMYLKAANKMPRKTMQKLAATHLTDEQVVQQCIQMKLSSPVE